VVRDAETQVRRLLSQILFFCECAFSNSVSKQSPGVIRKLIFVLKNTIFVADPYFGVYCPTCSNRMYVVKVGPRMSQGDACPITLSLAGGTPLNFQWV
jgi:hypothetical protein